MTTREAQVAHPMINADAFATYRGTGWQCIPLHRCDEVSTDRAGRARKDGKRPLHANWTARLYNTAKVITRCGLQGRNMGVRFTDRQMAIDVDPRNGGTEASRS